MFHKTIEDAQRNLKATGDPWIMENLTLFDPNYTYVRVLRDTSHQGLLEASDDGADTLADYVDAAEAARDNTLALTLLYLQMTHQHELPALSTRS
jgi:hypothetical protein